MVNTGPALGRRPAGCDPPAYAVYRAGGAPGTSVRTEPSKGPTLEETRPAAKSSIQSIAQAIYEEGRFSDMPVLADALEEAGCDDAEFLSHCREPGEHVRGCWVIDLLLGKE